MKRYVMLLALACSCSALMAEESESHKVAPVADTLSLEVEKVVSENLKEEVVKVIAEVAQELAEKVVAEKEAQTALSEDSSDVV